MLACNLIIEMYAHYLTSICLICQLGRVISRLGFKPGTTREEVLAALKNFGVNDHMYELMNVFELHSHVRHVFRRNFPQVLSRRVGPFPPA